MYSILVAVSLAVGLSLAIVRPIRLTMSPLAFGNSKRHKPLSKSDSFSGGTQAAIIVGKVSSIGFLVILVGTTVKPLGNIMGA
jgi:hypothetical protein